MRSSKIIRSRKPILVGFGCAVFAALAMFPFLVHRKFGNPAHASYPVSKKQVAEALGESPSFYRFPGEMDLSLMTGKPVHAIVQYSFDSKLQDAMEKMFEAYSPDYGAFVAIDAKTGRVLSIVSFTNDPAVKDNLALRATFPSASVFKVVTAAAAIENQKYSPDTIIPFNGRNHTLYRSNILKPKVTRWTRYISLKEAFAHSINTVFGTIGAFSVGAAELKEYAGRFGFGQPIEADFRMTEGHAAIPSDPQDMWALAQASSGFTRENTMSPLQGALIAASVVNDGEMMEPYLVQSVLTQDGNTIYNAEPTLAHHAMDPKTAEEMRELMHETITHGTSSGSFRGFFRKHELKNLNVGGKTGSLTGLNPAGKYDWFVGFADDGIRKIAVAALTVNKDLWRVKASYVARKAFETYFKTELAKQ